MEKDIIKNISIMKKLLPIGTSFDIVGRDWVVADKKAYIIFIDGFAKDDMMLFIMKNLSNFDNTSVNSDLITTITNTNIPYIEIQEFDDYNVCVDAILCGNAALFIDGSSKGILIDVRSYPARGPEEPEMEKVTRGSKDGFVETIIFNTALIRRRVRSKDLTFEMKQIGTYSKTDVAIGYINSLVNQNLVDNIRKKLDSIDIASLVMAEKTLEEQLIQKKWYNPLPQIRFTQRPDVLSAHLYEGHICILVDTSPTAMILPCTVFHFTQHAEDYYENPLVGTYLRWCRFLAIFIAFLLTPLWLWCCKNTDLLPHFLSFVGPKKSIFIPIFVQLFLLEIGIDFIKIASIHTPSTLSTSLGIIGGLLLSEFAISVGYFIPETIFYTAIIGICTFAIPSNEFSLAVKLFRMLLLILVGFFNTIGLIVGLIVILFITATTKTFGDKPYLWPLIPLDKSALSDLLIRKHIPKA